MCVLSNSFDVFWVHWLPRLVRLSAATEGVGRVNPPLARGISVADHSSDGGMLWERLSGDVPHSVAVSAIVMDWRSWVEVDDSLSPTG